MPDKQQPQPEAIASVVPEQIALLRDFFAGCAISGLLQRGESADIDSYWMELRARAAWEIADAMLAARGNHQAIQEPPPCRPTPLSQP